MKRCSLKILLMAILACMFAMCSNAALITAFANPSGMAGTDTVTYKTLPEKIPNAGPSATGEKAPAGPDRVNSEKVIAIVNEERAKAGLEPVVLDEAMMTGAKTRAQELQTLFSHTRPDGRDCFSIFTDLGIVSGYRGENAAYATPCTPELIMSGWMGSEGHKKNILDPRFKRIGVGYFETGDLGYWIQIFAE